MKKEVLGVSILLEHDCEGTELHRHFSLATQTFVEHQHPHDVCKHDYNRLHHHAPVDHHIFTLDELLNNERDTGERVNA